MDARGGGQGHWRKAAPPTKQVAWRPWRNTSSGNGPPDRPVGKWTEARTSTGPGKPGGGKAVSPKLYSARVTAKGPGVAGSGGLPCAEIRGAPPARSAHATRPAREIRRRILVMVCSFKKRRCADASRVGAYWFSRLLSSVPKFQRSVVSSGPYWTLTGSPVA